jgi:hypothetical protein
MVRSGVSAERRKLAIETMAALCRDAATWFKGARRAKSSGWSLYEPLKHSAGARRFQSRPQIGVGFFEREC